MGALPKEVIQKVIGRAKTQVRYCYEKELQKKPDLKGKISVEFIIAATGAVAKVQIRDSTLNDEALESCVSRVIKRMRFPKPAGGGIVEVNYPFVFKSAD